MTDFVATPGESLGEGALGVADTAAVAASPTPRRHLGLWIGLGVGAAVIAAAAATSTILIAPGTTVAGVHVGGLTPGAAAERIEQSLAGTEITLTGIDTAASVTAGALGASVDGLALASAAHSAHPMWNFGQWNPQPIVAPIELDEDQAEKELRTLAPASWVAPADASVAFDADSNTFVTTPGASGTGVDIDALQAALASAVTAGQTSLEASAAPVEVTPSVTDDEAESTAAALNDMLAEAGFYVGEERTVPISAATLAEWITVTSDGEQLVIEADTAAIQAVVDTLPEQVNRDAVDTEVIVDSHGKILREDGEGGRDGYQVVGLDGAAAAFAAQLKEGTAQFGLDVEVTAHERTEIVRKINVNLSTQRLTLYENDEAIDSWLISSGKSISPTHTGDYTIGWKTPKQTMRGYERVNGQKVKIPGWSGPTDSQGYAMFEQPDVRWAMYFNGNQAFHGVYWHSNWGNRMSHGCVGMPNSRAQQLYEWSPEGVEITIHN